LKASGLENVLKDYRFDNYVAKEPWQQGVIDKAKKFVNDEGNHWFFMGGQSGCGKTHLCTAVCREFLLKGKSVQYMLWRDDVTKLKSAVTDSEEYGKLIDRYKNADVLYIDDLFKTGKVDSGFQKPTAADINVAFEILNYRYNNPALITIISSELTEDELLDIDEATGGRIYERAKKAFSIGQDRKKNYRIKGVVTL
jgi:DNA replication protein DnaC